MLKHVCISRIVLLPQLRLVAFGPMLCFDLRFAFGLGLGFLLGHGMAVTLRGFDDILFDDQQQVNRFPTPLLVPWML